MRVDIPRRRPQRPARRRVGEGCSPAGVYASAAAVPRRIPGPGSHSASVLSCEKSWLQLAPAIAPGNDEQSHERTHPSDLSVVKTKGRSSVPRAGTSNAPARPGDLLVGRARTIRRDRARAYGHASRRTRAREGSSSAAFVLDPSSSRAFSRARDSSARREGWRVRDAGRRLGLDRPRRAWT